MFLKHCRAFCGKFLKYGLCICLIILQKWRFSIGWKNDKNIYILLHLVLWKELCWVFALTPLATSTCQCGQPPMQCPVYNMYVPQYHTIYCRTSQKKLENLIYQVIKTKPHIKDSLYTWQVGFGKVLGIWRGIQGFSQWDDKYNLFHPFIHLQSRVCTEPYKEGQWCHMSI